VFIRETSKADLDTVVELRLAFLAEHRGVDPTRFPSEFKAATVDFLRRHHESATSRSWLAEHDGIAVGVVTMLLLDLAPRPEDISGVDGYIINMYVAPAHRRHGLGRQLLAACRREADQLGLRRLLLYTTPDGKPLYESVGFEPNPSWMELLL
jgi:GNAT superfamily N-acetyltransferase